jgi:DNA repair exonuclease SbcCD ATPase subunit
MRIRSIALHNIKGYRGHRTFEGLGKGVILILGRNGCGKSTLAQAVGLAIFGTRPEAFKGSSGKSLTGFISQGCGEGHIEVIAEMGPERTLLFEVQLKAPSPTALSPKNIVTVRVFEEAVRNDPDRVNLAAGHTLEDIAEFTKNELGLRLKPQELYSKLLAPVQAGGLTEYLKKTPKKRQEQTEEILGLSPVRALAKSVRKLKGDQKKLKETRLEDLIFALDEAAKTHEAFESLSAEHRSTKPPFEGLDPLHVAQCTLQCRSELLPALVHASRLLTGAAKQTLGARKTRQQLEALAKELTHIDRALRARDAAKKEVDRLQAEATKAQAGAKEGQAYEAAQNEANQTQRQLNIASKTLAEAQVKVASLSAKQHALAETHKRQSTELETLEKARSTLDARREAAVREHLSLSTVSVAAEKTLQLAEAKARQLSLLGEVVDAIHGMDFDRLKAKIDALRDTTRLALLPDQARPIVDGLAHSMSDDLIASSGAQGQTVERIRVWEVEANTCVKALEKDHQAAEDKTQLAHRTIENIDRDDAKQQEQVTKLQSEVSTQSEEQTRVAESLTKSRETATELGQAHEGLQRSLETLQRDLNEDGRREGWIAWKAAVKEAQGLDQAFAERVLRTEAVQALVMDEARLVPFGLTLPSLDHTEAWQVLARTLEERRQEASHHVEEFMRAQNEAQRSQQHELQRIGELERQEADMQRRLGQLSDARASEKELGVLSDLILGRLPTMVAGTLVGRVSQLADEFFQSLFVQPGADLEMVWNPENYEVTLRRGDSVQPARFSSGGEQMAMGIALNLAVLHYMAPQARWLVLDEPTASLDTINRGALRDFVEQLGPGVSQEGRRLFDQLFFISHESKLFEGLGQTLNFDEGSDS